jgi:two-component system chemotaxis response regulator CheB
MRKTMIDVLIIDDLKSAREMIRDLLASDADIHVCAMADNSESAVKMVRHHCPHVIVLDSHLKGTTGYEVARAVIKERPTPIIMVAAGDEPLREASANPFACGVLDIFQKSDLYRWRTRPEAAEAFIRKIKLISKVKSPAIKKHCDTAKTPSAMKHLHPSPLFAANKPPMGTEKLVAIVSSTGGPNALFQILRALPADFPAPIVMVQHMSPGFIQGLAEWLDHEAHIRVRVAKDQEELHPGVGLLAPDDMHLTIGRKNRIRLVKTPPLGGHRPSGNVLLESVGTQYGPHAMAVILTGMGSDGADGMVTLKSAGGKTIAQDRETSVIFGMPNAAIKLGVVDQTLPLAQIAPAILKFVQGKAL